MNSDIIMGVYRMAFKAGLLLTERSGYVLQNTPWIYYIYISLNRYIEKEALTLCLESIVDLKPRLYYSYIHISALAKHLIYFTKKHKDVFRIIAEYY